MTIKVKQLRDRIAEICSEGEDFVGVGASAYDKAAVMAWGCLRRWKTARQTLLFPMRRRCWTSSKAPHSKETTNDRTSIRRKRLVPRYERRSGSECELVIRFQPVKEQDQ